MTGKGEFQGGDLVSLFPASGPSPSLWLKYDMAPSLPQGDAFAWGIYGYGINICIDLLGITDQSAGTGRWRQREEFDTSVYVKIGKSLSQFDDAKG